MKQRMTPTGKKLTPFHWPRLRHPLHWICGFISAACFLYPDHLIAVAAAILTFFAFFIYEWWEDRYLGDESWRDWWEFTAAFFISIVIILILKLIGVL
jgi:hypothetical protein